ncbi:FHA domain-containing protein [Humibacter ginsenosidimutans]|nr:FHA domain-containing protein [Humibacter ginsenosidimutans]
MAEAAPTSAATVEAPGVDLSAAATSDDIDRTIADLEVTVAGEDAVEPDLTHAPETPASDASGDTTGYDHLFGATMMRSIEDAAARPQHDEGEGAETSASVPAVGVPPVPTSAFGAAAAAPATQVPEPLGDHDGLTVMSGDLRALREAATALPSEPEAPLFGDVRHPAEAGFVLQLPDGRNEPIDGMVVVGRAPSVSKIAGDKVPRLVTVDSVEHDISRNHVQLTVEGGTVVVTDLHSRNGTLIALPGKTPQKLRAGEPTSVITGTVIDLGSGVTLGVAQA